MKVRYECDGGARDVVRLPGSKSISLRAELLSRIWASKIGKKEIGNIILNGVSDSDDYQDLHHAFKKLEDHADDCMTFYFGYGAAPMRFFLAYSSSIEGFHGKINCGEELKMRPVKPLVDALRTAGAEIEYIEENGRLPLYVKGHTLKSIDIAVGTRLSSQFTSALMMASLLWEKEYIPPVLNDAVSYPYIEMTEKMICQFKDLVREADGEKTLVYNIEKDWSAASYFYELALLAPDREIRIDGLIPPEKSLQGDSVYAEIFYKLGVVTIFNEAGTVIVKGNSEYISKLKENFEPLHFNLNDTPDLVPAVVTGMCLAGIPFFIDGIGHLRHKESNRLQALTIELAKAGFKLDKKGESLAWNGKRLDVRDGVVFDSHNDHRMAMALAIAAVKLGNVEIKGAECVSKSFPEFFAEIKKTGLVKL